MSATPDYGHVGAGRAVNGAAIGLGALLAGVEGGGTGGADAESSRDRAARTVAVAADVATRLATALGLGLAFGLVAAFAAAATADAADAVVPTRRAVVVSLVLSGPLSWLSAKPHLTAYVSLCRAVF